MNIDKIRELANNLAAEQAEIRHHLHAHPEIGWNEVETSKFIEGKLREFGLDNIKRGFGGTECGVIADLTGDASGPCIALRADIDALPLAEENDVEYRSRNNGVMHACGHDGHMATLLGTAKLLASIKKEIKGRVRFIFQPAEEIGINSGAKKMIEDGVLNGVDMIIGMHLWSFLETGKVHWRVGPAMASADWWSVKFTGRGGHGAMPHEAIDPTVAAANFIGAVQTVVSREIDPVDTAVVSVGKLTSGDAFNIIPNSAELLGTTRTFNQEVRGKMESRISRVAEGIAAAYRCTAETGYCYMYPCVINHKDVTALLVETASDVVGPDMVEESPLLMVSEDFSYYLEKIPGTFFFMGSGCKEKSTDFAHHSPHFNIDDTALPLATTLFSSFVFRAVDSLKAGKIAK